MKIVLTAGGSGGHFYPLISVADKIREISEKEKMVSPDIYYLANDPYDRDILFKNDIQFVKIYAGKMRTYFSVRNFFGLFKTFFGTLKSIYIIFKIFPDVVFTNGSYVAFPVLVAARIFGIPVVLHSSDTIPSRVILFASKYAKKISVAFSESADYLPKEKIVLLGNPVRDEIKNKEVGDSKSFLGLEYGIKTIFVLGGSQGAKAINDVILGSLPELLKEYQIIHQVGKKNIEEVYGRSGVILYDNPLKKRYKIFDYMDDLNLRMAAGAADLIISRAGAGSIYEIANWGVPSILIPIDGKVSRDQETNAFSYARDGGGIFIKEKNLSSGILRLEIKRILENEKIYNDMKLKSKAFSKPEASEKIAEQIIKIGISHKK